MGDISGVGVAYRGLTVDAAGRVAGTVVDAEITSKGL